GLPSENAHVGQDACDACCRSFLPTRDDLNPVVAALVWSRSQAALNQMTDHGSDFVTRLQMVNRFAEESLPVLRKDEEDVPPSPRTCSGVDCRNAEDI